MLSSLREETEGKLQMLLLPRKNGLDSLFKEVTVFLREKLNRGVSKPGGFPLFRERSRLCRGPFWDCSS